VRQGCWLTEQQHEERWSGGTLVSTWAGLLLKCAGNPLATQHHTALLYKTHIVLDPEQVSQSPLAPPPPTTHTHAPTPLLPLCCLLLQYQGFPGMGLPDMQQAAGLMAAASAAAAAGGMQQQQLGLEGLEGALGLKTEADGEHT